MNGKQKFKVTPIAAAVSSALLIGTTAPAFAQDEALEEVVVTGIRGSLRSSMNIKRDSAGVVDAITAEDIGKFPDTNLAESMQRITGVSISRVEGEGSEITVRGISGDYNLVTLNGRQVPSAVAFGGGSGAGGTLGQDGNSRAFDFANLASESVSAVEVYKTGRASISTGGIGATVDIITRRPLMDPGLHGSVGVKAINDTTTETGEDITPEVSGVLSWTDDSQTFGVALSAIYQERDSGKAGVSVNDWNIGRWGEDSLYSLVPGAVVENAPAAGQLYARPNDVRYAVSDTHRERTNALLTLQFQPTEDFTATLDGLFAENNIEERRSETTSWIANNTSVTRVVFDGADGIASPQRIEEALSTKDHGMEQQLRVQNNTLEQIGLNLDWDLNDTLGLRFDVHNSTMESLPDGPGKSGEIAFSMATPVQTSQFLDFSTEIPTYNFTWDDSVPDDRVGTGSITGYWGNNNGQFDAGDVGSQVLRVFYNGQTTEITQARLDGSLNFDEGGRFDFGVESRAMEMQQQSSDRYMALGDWGVARPDDVPDELLEPLNLAARFDDFDTSSSSQVAFRGDAEALGAWGVDYWDDGSGNYQLAYNPNFSNNTQVEEDTFAAYFQMSFSTEIGGMETNMLAGLRYEQTDVTSVADLLIPQYLLWQDNNDFQTVRDTAVTAYAVDADYDNLLPSFDFDILLTETLKARFSYSKTIARAPYGDLNPSVSGTGITGSTLNGAQATADSGNPALVPLESDNVDLSLEWYYDEASYASVGLFEKRIQNFIGTAQIDTPQFDILDQTGGPRAEAAAAALTAGGFPVDDTSLFVMMALIENDPAGAAAYTGTAQQAVAVATQYDIVPEDGDPLMIFRTSTQVNNQEAQLYGAEFAVQHFFGESGFGVQANYTVVNGDVGFDNLADPDVTQFAVPGQSDTANLVGIFENDFLQLRVAYNWRDSYLNQINFRASNNPIYVDEYYQLDMTATWLATENLAISFEGLNVTEENIRWFGRSESQVWYSEDLGARYQVGARYTFD